MYVAPAAYNTVRALYPSYKLDDWESLSDAMRSRYCAAASWAEHRQFSSEDLHHRVQQLWRCPPEVPALFPDLPRSELAQALQHYTTVLHALLDVLDAGTRSDDDC